MKKIVSVSILTLCLFIVTPSFAGPYNNSLRETTNSWTQRKDAPTLRGGKVLEDTEMQGDPDVPIQDAVWVLVLLSGVYVTVRRRANRD